MKKVDVLPSREDVTNAVKRKRRVHPIQRGMVIKVNILLFDGKGNV